MSFMFNPNPYDDPASINYPVVPQGTAKRVIIGEKAIAKQLIDDAVTSCNKNGACVLCVDGYPAVQFEQLIGQLKVLGLAAGLAVRAFNTRDAAKSADAIEKLLEKNLPQDKEADPVLLYGRLFDGSYADMFDAQKIDQLKSEIKNHKGLYVVYGNGAAYEGLSDLYDLRVWMDITPKNAILNIKSGSFTNLGDTKARPFKEAMRRAYYCDFFLSEHLRKKLTTGGGLNYYISANQTAHLQMMPFDVFETVLSALVKSPYRCRPVYIEGVWGGQYIKKVRNLPDSVKNVAWCFDMIPLEVSIVAEIEGLQLEFPYHTFVQKEGKQIMGEKALKDFGGYFPVRFNYDDTWHASGNMSIQVHPGEKFVRENYNDLGRQDESYYIVATGHDAKTYCGFNNGVDAKEFIKEFKRSEKDFQPVDYEHYVYAEDSVPGKQFMLPAGTIHASGQNQVILEIGSLTVGSYTFKMYDYLRPDLDGKPRPIHSKYAEEVLLTDCDADYAKKNLIKQPVLLREGEGFKEVIVGECEELYFSLRRFEFEKQVQDDTAGQFHALTLVDGEKATVRSIDNPDLCYHMNYLDMVIVPANVGRYEIINEGVQPTMVVHKTQLKG